MAKIVDTNYNEKFSLPYPIGRLNPTPADSTEVWDTLALAEDYAANGATAYVGQIIYVKATAKHYKITNEAGDLVLLAGDLEHIWRGYYWNGEFYKTSEYLEVMSHDGQKFYVDINTNNTYLYQGDGKGYKEVIQIPTATDQLAGILKLYTTHGQNTDGTMTQKAITDAVDEIKLAIDTNDSECLVLNKPW